MQASSDLSLNIRSARKKFIAMAITYCLGVFNDNYFKQAAMLLAVAAGCNHLQGWATVLFALPFILFSAHGGWCADRFPKKRVVIMSKGLELAAMLAGGSGLLSGNWHLILAMVFLMGLQSTFFSPALNGSIPELYPAEYVPRANAFLKLVTTLAILTGVTFAGISLDQHWFDSGGLPFGILVVAGGAVLVALIGFMASFGVGRRPAAAPNKAFPWLGPWHSLKDLADICRDRQLLLAVLADAHFYFSASLTLLIVNTLGLQELGFSQTRTSLLSMSMMLGVCGGAFLAARLVSMQNWSAMLVRSATGLAGGLLLAGMTAVIPATGRFWWLAAALIAAGVAGGLFLIPVASLLQVRPAAAEKGRVLAAAGFSSFTAILGAGLLFSALGAHFRPSGLMCGLGFFGLLVSGGLRLLERPGKSLSSRLVGRILKNLLALRYAIDISGLEKIEAIPGRSILFLPNHPALIDPVIVMSAIHSRFTPRPLADAAQINRPVLRQLMQSFRPITLADVGKAGQAGKQQAQAALSAVVNALRQGENILLYPAGRLSRSPKEHLGANSGVEFIVGQVPNVQVVLVRTTGLWGSSFSRASGTPPSPAKYLWKYLAALFCNLLFFGPRRKVTLEFVPDHRVIELKNRLSINRHLESFYNTHTAGNTQVPYFWWQGRTPRLIPDKIGTPSNGRRLADIPESVQRLVLTKLTEIAGMTVTGGMHLANDLGLDSLTLLEFCAWLESEFGIAINDGAQLLTVDDCILAAGGLLLNPADVTIKAPPRRWHAANGRPLALSRAKTIPAGFLHQARQTPGRVILADPVAGARTYREILTAIFLLLPRIRNIKAQRVGIMLPASVSSAIAYLTVLFAGKTPVIFNWTTGIATMAHGIRTTQVNCMISAHKLCRRVEDQQGVALTKLGIDWLYLDEIFGKLSRTTKLLAGLQSFFCRHRLAAAPKNDVAAILFTSGSESLPKAVPLTHGNILANLADLAQVMHFPDNTRLLGMLPPFHSLGLVGTIIMPLCLGLPTVYHPNPTEPAILAQIISQYRVSMLVSTPTFLSGILQAGTRDQLASLHMVFTGAEKCPPLIRHRLQGTNDRAVLCEGYGITECSPLVSINTPKAARPGTIGRVLPSVEYAIVNDHCTARVAAGGQGLLLVRGPSIFDGYIGAEPGQGFVEFEGRRWYQTGDVVREDSDNHLIFCGRKKRFVKIGGEMISLPAIETVLLKGFGNNTDNGPALAVEATPDDGHPEIVLFTTRRLERETVNKYLKNAGLSALHHIRRMVPVETIPLLGTGKTDYRCLRQKLAA